MDISKYIMMESSHVDFKEMLETKKAKNWLKTISAFANTGEGIYFLVCAIQIESWSV